MNTLPFPPFPHISPIFKLLMLTILLVPPIYFGATLEPKCAGDGPEYFLQLWALSSHLTPDLRVSDVENLSTYVHDRKLLDFKDSYFQAWKNQIQSGGSRSAYLFRSPSGAYYALHFWLYSALAVPMKWELHLVGGNELKAFQLTNAFMLDLGLASLFFVRSLSIEMTIAVALLLYGVGTPYYLQWPHPELFAAITSFTGSVAFLERRLVSATFLFALGATQNPSMAMMIPAIFASDIMNWVGLSLRGKAKRIAWFFGAGSLSLASFLFFQTTFGIPSLISTEGYLHPEFVDFDRLYSLFFDLNQGMLVGAGWVMALSAAMLVTRLPELWQDPAQRISPLVFRREDWLLIGVVLMAVGVLPQVNWNSGQAVYTRYAFWLSMPVLAWMVSQVPKRKIWWLALVVAAQIVTVYSFGAFTRTDQEAFYLSYKRIAVLTLRYVPWAYNPEPEIFVERTLGREFDEMWPDSIVFIPYNKGDVMTKILVRGPHRQRLSEKICGSGAELRTKHGEGIQPKMFKKVRLDYYYLSGGFVCFPREQASR